MSLAVIYIHGFNSSPLSVKAQQLQTYFDQHKLIERQGYQLHIPALDWRPKIAVEQLVRIIERQLIDTDKPNILLIGSSLGGYYSLWLAQKYPQCSAVLINPAVYPYVLLQALLGENQNIYTGHRYRLTAEHIEQLKALEVAQLRDPQRILLLSQSADETLDYREAVDKLQGVEQRVTAGGSHSYENFDTQLAAIFAFVGA